MRCVYCVKSALRIDREFTHQILTAFDGYWETGRVETVRRSLDELSQDSEMELLDNDELEDSLAITNMISKSENRYSRERYALGQRFAYLLTSGRQDTGTSSEKTPLEPAVICNAFQSAVQEVPVDIPVKLVVYKHFEKHVIHYLGGLYDEINLLFSKSGIIPKLAPKVRRNPVAPSMQQCKSSSSSTQQVIPVLRMRVLRRVAFRVLGSMPFRMRSLPPYNSYSIYVEPLDGESMLTASSMISTGVSSVPLPAVDSGELLGALSALQQSNVLILPQAAGQVVNPKHLRARLVEDLHMREDGELNRTLGDADNDTIDVISMLFEFILDDSTLPDAMKALLSRLQIPMLKVAIIDKTFFSTKGHPARHLLNNMAQAAIGWNDNGER